MIMVVKEYTRMRECRRCHTIYRAKKKYSHICPNCYRKVGGANGK